MRNERIASAMSAAGDRIFDFMKHQLAHLEHVGAEAIED